MPGWIKRKIDNCFGTPEKKAKMFLWLVYIINLYVMFGIFVLIWVLYGEHIIELWRALT